METTVDPNLVVLFEKAQVKTSSTPKAAKRAGGKGREGLIPIRRAVVGRKGKVHMQTYWVSPKDLRQMSMSNAVRFMDGMVKAQQYYKTVLDKLAPHLEDGGKAIYEKMQRTGASMVRIGKVQMSISSFIKQDPVSGDRLLAAINSRAESEVPLKVKNAINRLYQQITTSTFGKELKVSSATAESKVRVEEQKAPYKWAPKDWASKFVELMSKKVEEVKRILSARQKGETLSGQKAPQSPRSLAAKPKKTSAKIELKKVESSNLDAVGYDPNTKTLRVRFKGGATYDYYDVPEKEHKDLLSAKSKGSYFSTRVKDKYKYDRVEVA